MLDITGIRPEITKYKKMIVLFIENLEEIMISKCFIFSDQENSEIYIV